MLPSTRAARRRGISHSSATYEKSFNGLWLSRVVLHGGESHGPDTDQNGSDPTSSKEETGSDLDLYCRPNTRLFEPKPAARRPPQTPIRPVARPRPRNRPHGPRIPDEPPPVAYPPAPSRALGKRLSPTDRDTLIAAFNAGASQQHLATEYGISIRSVKRLVHGNSNRPQATDNRLTPDQRHTIAHTYATTGTTQAELARATASTSAPSNAYSANTDRPKAKSHWPVLGQARSACPTWG